MDERDNKIIRFPGTGYRLTGKPAIEPTAKLAVGPVSFYCTGCGETCHADFHKMIFRTLDFFCARCGSAHKLTNPGFANIAPRSKR